LGEPDGLTLTFLSQFVSGAWFMASQPKTKFVIFGRRGISLVSRAQALVGLTGLEPVTLRLSSACSNQLSYRP
jgi:hypothetical protein